LKFILILILGYSAVWLIFFLIRSERVMAYGDDVCFDDWCATILEIQKGPEIQQQFAPISQDSLWIVLNVRMSNHARGIAQKPSEPRVFIVDQKGYSWYPSLKGQQKLEADFGPQVSLGEKLALHQALTTKIVYSLPKRSENLRIIIAEGPFITKLLFPEDQADFVIP
jgi:hypothetical protein